MPYVARLRPPLHLPHAADVPDPDSTTLVKSFTAVLLLVYGMPVLVLVLLAIFFPPQTIDFVPPKISEINLSLFTPSPPHISLPTRPQLNVRPKNTLVESDNDTNLTSRSQQSRKPDSVMPDIVSLNKHGDSLWESPNTPKSREVRQSSPTPNPSPAQEQQNPNTLFKTPQPQPQPITPQPKPMQYTPDGLPVLPPLDAPTLAASDPHTSEMQQRLQQMLQQTQANTDGRAGMSGEPSPEAMATDLGRYKMIVYRAVGSRWYPKVNNQLQVLPVGSVRVQYTIYADGTVTTKVLDGGTGTLELLLAISRNAITEAAPFPPFSPAMEKAVGGSYTDDFTFSIYGD
ncbi:MAG TPA: hypothetical protein VL981_02195 [Candidatus Methylacidiphilales bacterium]|nr:hypothetical protein [Candidatus Methylacidiphilales bacterium]